MSVTGQDLSISISILTIADAVSCFAAIKTRDDDPFLFNLLLRAILGDMAKFTAVAALTEATTDRLTSVFQSRHVLLLVFGPLLSLTWASRVRTESIGDLVRLVQIALKVHVRQGTHHRLVFQSNEIQFDPLTTESDLQFAVSCTRACLDVLLDGLFDIVHIPLSGSLGDLVPRDLRVDLFNVRTVNLSWVLALNDRMT